VNFSGPPRHARGAAAGDRQGRHAAPGVRLSLESRPKRQKDAARRIIRVAVSLPSPKRVVLLTLSLLAAGCASTPSTPRQPPGRPPTPASVTKNEPGGDADDPHRAALERMLGEPWGSRNDRDDQVVAPLPDATKWRRIRYYGFDHLAGFRYGKTYHAVGAVAVQNMPAGTPVRSETCLAEFEAWARPQLKGLDVRFEPFRTKLARWRDQTLVIQSMDGFVSWGISSTEFSAAWAAYPAYKDACIIYAVAVAWRDSKELAQKVRDRYVEEGFANLQALTEEKAFRRPRPSSDEKPPDEPGAPPKPLFDFLFRKSTNER
jgi:hypothetical protein